MPNYKQLVFRSVLIWLVVSFFYACNGVSDQERVSVDSGMSPVPILVTEMHPWIRAKQIAEQVPNSDVFVGHGNAMMPLYSDETVLVIQKLELSHLRSGMTIIYADNGVVPDNLKSVVLIKQHKDRRWEFATSEENAVRHFMDLNEENYLGTVVAALARASEEQKIMHRESMASSTNLNCTIQCHVAGEIHPRVVPGLKPKITTFDLSQDK